MGLQETYRLIFKSNWYSIILLIGLLSVSILCALNDLIVLFVFFFPFLIWMIFDKTYVFIILLFFTITIISPIDQKTKTTIFIGNYRLQDYLLVLLITVYIIKLLLRGNLKFNDYYKNHLFIAIILYFLVFIIGLINKIVTSGINLFFRLELIDTLYYLVFFILLYEITNLKRFKIVLICAMVGMFLYSIHALLMSYLYVNELRYVTGNTVLLPIFILHTMAFLLYTQNGKEKIFFTLSLFLPFLALIFSFTKGHFIGTFAGLFFLLFIVFIESKNRLKFIRVFAFLCFVVSLSIIFVIFSRGTSTTDLEKETFFRGSDKNEEFISSNVNVNLKGLGNIGNADRFLEVIIVLKDLQKNPILGKGIGGTIYMYRFTRDKWMEWFFIHNQYAKILNQLGLLGLFTFFLWIFIFFKVAFNTYKKISNPVYKSIIVGFISTYIYLLVVSFTSNFLFHPASNLYIAFMMAGVLIINKFAISSETIELNKLPENHNISNNTIETL